MSEFNFDSNVNTSFYNTEQLKFLCSAISELSSEKKIKLVVNNDLIDTSYTYKEVIRQPRSLDIETDPFTTISTCILNDLIYICLAQETSFPDVYPLLKKCILTCFGDVNYEFRIFKNNTASHIYNINLMSHKHSFMLLSFLIVDDINQKASLILKDIMYDEWKKFDVPFETVNGCLDKSFYMLVSILIKEIIVYKGSIKTLNDLGISYDGLSGIDDEHLKLIEMLFV
jgi:hypothetical protein